MFFIKVSTKKKKGLTIIELIISLSLVTVIMFVIVSAFVSFSKIYKNTSQYSKSNVNTKEALFFIEKEIEEYGSRALIKDNTLYIHKNAYTKNKVGRNANTLYYYYQEGNKGYTSQPLLYDVTLFEVKEKENLIYVKLKIKDGKEFERYFVK